jgi:hypothetical protein
MRLVLVLLFLSFNVTGEEYVCQLEYSDNPSYRNFVSYIRTENGFRSESGNMLLPNYEYQPSEVQENETTILLSRVNNFESRLTMIDKNTPRVTQEWMYTDPEKSEDDLLRGLKHGNCVVKE